jgi:hypothetical protein
MTSIFPGRPTVSRQVSRALAAMTPTTADAAVAVGSCWRSIREAASRQLAADQTNPGQRGLQLCLGLIWLLGRRTAVPAIHVRARVRHPDHRACRGRQSPGSRAQSPGSARRCSTKWQPQRGVRQRPVADRGLAAFPPHRQARIGPVDHVGCLRVLGSAKAWAATLKARPRWQVFRAPSSSTRC